MPKSRIPRIIHRIWIRTPRPARVDEWWETWRTFNPLWEMRTWGDAEVDSLIGDLGLSGAFEWAARPVLQADIARLAILWQYGGLYVDADFECLKSVDPLVSEWERAGHRFVMAREANRPGESQVIISNAIAFAEKRHEATKWMLIEASKRLTAAQGYSRSPNPMYVTGPNLWRDAAAGHPDSVWMAPPVTFMPFDAGMMTTRPVNMSRIPLGIDIPDGTYAVHHSAATWIGGK